MNWEKVAPRLEKLARESSGYAELCDKLSVLLGREISRDAVRRARRKLVDKGYEIPEFQHLFAQSNSDHFDEEKPPTKKRPSANALELMKWATPRQREALKALLRFGSVADAAEELGITPGRVRSLLSEVKRKAARQGWAPANDMDKTIPPGFHAKGVSTYYDKDGKRKGQWVKTAIDQEHKLTLLLDALQTVAEPLKAKSEFVPTPKHSDKDLFCVYPMGDPHLGMYAWAAETGEDFDLEIAESNLVEAVDQLVHVAPSSEECLIVNLGDFFHSDSNDNMTRRSGNPLDVDTRWSKVLAVGIRTMRRCIDKCLEKHKKVNVVCEIGNHDDHSALMLGLCLQQYYENNPRVHIDTSPELFHWFRFGENLIGITHGHNTKPNDLPNIMAHDRKEDWGATSFRYWYTGHIHHDTLKEYPGCIVETFRTLAARDAWHHGKGYRSGRDMKVDVLHREYGRINRHIVGIKQIWGAKKN